MAGGKKKKGARGDEAGGRGQKAPSKKGTSQHKEPAENEVDEDESVQQGEEGEPVVEEVTQRLGKVKLAPSPEVKAKEINGRTLKY